jgi:hypothetical protein
MGLKDYLDDDPTKNLNKWLSHYDLTILYILL